VGGFDSILDLVNHAVASLRTADVHNSALLFLAAVFVWSGTAKLRRPTLTALALVDFGLAESVKPRLGVVLASSELGVAALLILGAVEGAPYRTLATSVALVLLMSFVALITRALIRGERFACFCFGDAGAGLSRFTLVRAGALAALALALVLLHPGADATPTARALLLQALVAVGVVAFFLHLSHLRQLMLARRRVVRAEGGAA
jgi:hypothetical protein